MKFHRRESINFVCLCVVEDIEKRFSEKRQAWYFKILSTEGSCFLCFEISCYDALSALLPEYVGLIEIRGTVEQKRGGTYLCAKSFHYRDNSGNYTSLTLEDKGAEEKRGGETNGNSNVQG